MFPPPRMSSALKMVACGMSPKSDAARTSETMRGNVTGSFEDWRRDRELHMSMAMWAKRPRDAPSVSTAASTGLRLWSRYVSEMSSLTRLR